MKKLMFLAVIVLGMVSLSHADTRRATQFTGDNMAFSKVTLSSVTWTSLAAYSNARGAITCVNSDTSNQIWISTAATAAIGGAGTFPIYSKQSFQIQNNSSIQGLADTGVTSSIVYCGKEDGL